MAQADDAQIAATKPVEATEPPKCDPSPTACADDATTIAHLRTEFRAAAARSLQRDVGVAARNGLARIRDDAFHLGAVDARRAILSQTERPSAQSPDPGADDTHYESSAGAVHDDTIVPDPLNEAFDRRVQMLRSNEPTWRRLRAWAARPVSADYVSEAWLRSAFGQLHPSQAYALHVWSERASTDFTRDVLRTGDADGSLHALSSRDDNPLNWVGTLRDRRVFADFSADAPERVHAQLARYDQGLDDPGSLRRTSTLAAIDQHAPGSLYDNLFPAVADTSHDPNIGAPGGDVGSGSGGGGGGGEGRAAAGAGERGLASAEGSMARGAARAEGGFMRVAARSFGMIRFSSRVGGVVFGRPPDDGGHPPDIVAVSGETNARNQILLHVDLRDHTHITLGPYHPAIVQHALAYAADGRVVVSTLPQPLQSADDSLQIPGRRVVVHPAFEDTAFACSAIQIDRFVDTFTNTKPQPAEVKSFHKIEVARQGVTDLGILLSREASEMPDADRIKALKVIQAYAATCSDDARCFPLHDYETLGMNFGTGSQLVGCLRHATDDDALKACWTQFKQTVHRNTYMVDSGVRERPYRVDPQLRYVSGQTDGRDQLWPLEFMIQAVPTGADGQQADISQGNGHDPWQFPDIAGDLQSLVAQSVAGNPDAAEIFRNIRDFVALQRFFRTALDGSLGSQFPLGDLVKLSALTRPYVQVRRNERWNMSESMWRFVYQVQIAVVKRLQETLKASPVGDTCRVPVSQMLAARSQDPSAHPAEFWTFMASFDRYCSNEPSMAAVLNFQRTVREQELLADILALGRASEQRHGGLSCEAL
jgi:hypothetical protein